MPVTNCTALQAMLNIVIMIGIQSVNQPNAAGATACAVQQAQDNSLQAMVLQAHQQHAEK